MDIHGGEQNRKEFKVYVRVCNNKLGKINVI